MAKFDFLTKYNKKAIETLRREAEHEAELISELAAKESKTFSNPALKEGLEQIDISSLPKTNETGFNLVGSPAEKGFVLGESGPISRVPSVIKKAEEAPKYLPAVIDNGEQLSAKLASAADLPVNSELEKFNKMKAMLATLGAGTAATLGMGAMNSSGNKQPQQAAVAPIAPQAEVAPKIEPVAPVVPEVTETEKTLESMRNKMRMPSAVESAPAPSVREIDFGDNTTSFKEGLKQAQDNRDIGVLINSLGKAADIAGSGMSGTQPKFGGVFDQNIKNAEGFVTDFEKQAKFEKEDPNSAMSKGYRDLAKAMGFNIKGQASAADLEKVLPQLANVYNQQEAQKARKETAKENREFRLQELDMRLANQRDASKEKEKIKASDKMDKLITGTRKELDSGTLQKARQSYLTADRMMRSLKEFAENPTGYSDYGTLMGGLKVLQGDDSVVREAEIRLGMNAGSLGDKIRNQISQLATGKSLQPKQRQDIIKTIEAMGAISKSMYLKEIQPIVTSARKRNVPMEELFSDNIIADLNNSSSDPRQPTGTGKSVVKKGYNAKTNQTQLIYSDGTKEIVDGRR